MVSSDVVADPVSLELAPGLGVARVVLKPRKARPFYSRHPWVLNTAIDRVEGTPADGDVVDLFADNSKFVARGIYNSRSRIRVRLMTWNPVELIDDALIERRLATAIEFRRTLGYDQLDGAARLVFSEADGLSGLIVDRYAQYLTLQVNALGLAMRLPAIIAALVKLVHPRGIIVRTEKGAPQAEGIELRDGLVWGEMPDGPVFIEENGLRWGVDLAEGQKTGYYLDQRDNRRVAAMYLQGRRVLDMFCYSGGFALNAAHHGAAAEVIAYDSSQKALTLARANAQLNSISNVHFEAEDCFDALDRLVRVNQKFGGVILDPPKFARSRQAVDEAMRAYHRLNRLAVDLLEPGGILVTCSCSGHVTREDFIHMLVGVAQQSKRDIQILEQRGASPDHPVAATCLETEYLKCFICRVV
jgi:23S rRNA (cytosine1962-C5)-methyltransferase